MNWEANWNAEIGLWSLEGPGHTPATKDLATVHAGPSSASRLLAAAELGALEEIEVQRVLTALRAMQWTTDDDLRGCMRWFWEEDRPYDTNASFFTGLSLVVLRKLFYDRLDRRCRALLDEILSGLDVWFQRAVAGASYHYPNKYLGDLVCGWLLVEITSRVDEDQLVAQHMRRAAAYWLAHHWGWGEHLSDVYARVCLDELAVLLMLAERLPEDLRQMYMGLADALLAIEDGFGGGPRVPALRSYAFQQPQSPLNYRDKVRPWQGSPQRQGNMPDLGNLMYGVGWQEAMPARRPPQRDLRIPCFGGAVATARVEDDIRLGSMSRFPVMPTAEHPTWGLSWQCFPVVFSRGASDWGFLQWEAMEDGVRRAHPANGGPFAHIPKALTDAVTPPVFGQTYAIQRGAGVLVLRVMRVVPKRWQAITDRLRLVGATAEVRTTHQDGWSQLVLRYPEREVSVHYVALVRGGQPELASGTPGAVDWNVSCRAPELHERRIVAHLWAISLDGPVDTAPEIRILGGTPEVRSAEERTRAVTWAWRELRWQVVIDSLAETPLVEVS